MDEMSEMDRSETMPEEGQEHRSRGRWGMVAAIAAAVIGMFAARRVRSARQHRTPITIA